jgi:hypothetical protein
MKVIDTRGRELLTAGALNLLPVPNATALDIAGSWDISAARTAVKVNVTESGTGTASRLLLDLEVGGTSKWICDTTGKVTQAGALKFAAASLLSTPEAGAMEYDTNSHFRLTEDSRRYIVQADNEDIGGSGDIPSAGFITLRINGQSIKVLVADYT